MTTFAQELTVMRRFLRDPDGDIWSDYDIQANWDDAQKEIALKAGYLERAHVYKYPPEWTVSYMNDWEWGYIDGDKYHCLMTWPQRGAIICYPWEAGYDRTNASAADSGYRFTHPWEAFYGSPADYVPVPLHDNFHRMRLLAYDEEVLTFAERKRIAEADSSYKTASGDPAHYYRPDEYHNQFVLYPRSSSITWDDTDLLSEDVTDTFDDTGGIYAWDDAHLGEGDSGMTVEAISIDGQIFTVFEATPSNVGDDPGDWERELDLPGFLTKYVRYGTLERCYGANTDGFIPSLRDFWQLRKEMGIRAIKRFKGLRTSDREYRLGGHKKPWRSRHPRLPSAYPRQAV